MTTRLAILTNMPKIYTNLKEIRNIVAREKPSKTVLVTSRILQEKLSWAIKLIKPHETILIPDGEAAKTWRCLEKLLIHFNKVGLDRKGLIIILGGGTVGDLVGFAASIYLRGIKYIQIPTTLVAQTDSAHGGKTGINFEKYKNQIGTTNSPIAIVVDQRFIKTNSHAQITDGLGEVIKYGLIKDAQIVKLLEKQKVSTLRESKDLQKIITRSIEVKNYYTSRDPLDRGIRQMLNFGHTVGHAVELKYNLGHGRAILHGMVKELEITEKLGLTKPAVRGNLLNLYKNLGIEYTANLKLDWRTIVRDKKFQGDVIDLPVVIQEGQSKLVKVKAAKLRSLLGL
jgi:3-dehydroquinate synthase